MTRPMQGINQAFAYRLLSPMLYLPWIWTQFFASAISWVFIALYSIWSWNTTFYYYPMWGLAIFFLIAPFQESQQEIIKIVEIVVEGITGFLNDTVFPVFEDMLYVIQPACWAHNFLWDGSVFIFKLALYNPIVVAVNFAFPYNPWAFFKDITLSTGSFPVTTFADTSSSPDWLVGPYDRSTKHPILDTKRFVQGGDPVVDALVRWSRQHHKKGQVKLNLNMDELQRWTDPDVPEYYRRSISRRILRRVMDRELGIEEPGWWEQAENTKPAKPSAWARVFDVGYQGAGWRSIGMVRMDHPPELPAYAKAKGLEMPPGAVAYRILADDKGTRDLNFAIFQCTAEIFSIFFDVIAQVLVQLWNILLVIGENLFDDIENFFTDAFSFVANIFNQIWKEFLNLPCLKFDSVEVFAISLLDCICEPLTLAIIDLGGEKMDTWFNYERPNGINGIPQAILGCVGLGCVDINLLITKPNAFVTGLVGDCMGLPDIAVCCIVDIPNCIQSVIISLTNCPCAGGGSVGAPKCDFGINDGSDWFKCILIFFSNEVLSTLGGGSPTNCDFTTCPSLNGVANGIIQCIAASLLDLDFFIDTISNIFGLGGGGGCSWKNPQKCSPFRRRRRGSVEQMSLRDDPKQDAMYGPIEPSSLAMPVPVTTMFPEDNLESLPGGLREQSIWAPVLSSRSSDIYQTEAYRNKTEARYASMLKTLRGYQQNRLIRYEEVSLMKQLSDAMNPHSRSRHRALLQAQVDRHVYSNPAIRVATSRLTEICRDLMDFFEFRVYGPDPFTMPPDDADPSKDPRTVSAPRYVDQTASHNHAYMMHAQTVADNPYYAGLYKLLFQSGDVDSISSGNADNDAAWKAMGGHGGDPLFHIGRIMATSRQLLFAYGQIFTEVWWDSNTYSFHFPNYAQIGHILVQTRVPLYLDDMRAAVSGLLKVHSDTATAYLDKRAAEFAERGDGDQRSDGKSDYGALVRNYAGIVQTEVAIRTIVIRMLVPDKVDAMLDELSTRSAVHARYSQRMKRRLTQRRRQSLHKQTSLTSQIEAWRRQHHGSNAGVSDGVLGHSNRIIIDLDALTHPQAGNVTLQVNQRVRFVDGLEGTFVGTVGSMVGFSPTRSLGGGTSEVQRVAIMAIFGAVKDVVMFVVNNWQLIATFLGTILMSPWGRVIWESYVLFIYQRVIVPLFSHGLLKTFGSLDKILTLTLDFIVLTDTIAFFLMNEIARYIGCYGWALAVIAVVLPIVMILNFLTLGMLRPLIIPLMLLLILFLIFFPYCPPEQVIKNNKMTQIGPWKYYDDIIQCFADEISGPAKDAYNGICSVADDCKGAAPCICENKGGQYGSVFMTFQDNTRCGTVQAPTGQCLCWPKLDCQFLFFRINNDNLFADSCEDLGYRLKIAWYQPVGYLQIFTNCYFNFWISLKYITRTLTRAPGLPSLLFPIFIAIGMLVFFYLSFAVGAVVIALVMGYEYALPLWKDLVIKSVIPALEMAFGGIPLVSYLSNYGMSFLRFPNFTDGQPLGFNRPGEGTCFIFNLGTFFGGAAVNFWYWALILALAWYGLGSILWFIFNNIMVPIRIFMAPIWLYRQRGRLDRHYDTAKNLLKAAVPNWLRNRGVGKVGSALWSTAKTVGAALEPQAPDTGLTRWISRYYPNPYHSMAAIMNPQGTNPYIMTPGVPIHIDGRSQAFSSSDRRSRRQPVTAEKDKKKT